MEASAKSTSTHIGRKIGRIRELRNMKQETLAAELGVTQQTVSKMEQSEVLDDEILYKVAKALGMEPEAIRKFDEEMALNFFNNISNNQFHENAIAFIYQQINPIEKIIELYERLLQSEKEKVEILRGRKGY